MYSIMIFDDENTNRQGLINFIDWDSMDCKIIGEAADGIEAREKITANPPDIIISDIKMPGIDGIQLAQFIYENHPASKIILLTGYSEFEYAQSAIKYGVVDFILKPSSTEKIFEAVNKAKNLIIKDREKDNRLHSLENKVIENYAQMREKFILDYINGIIFEPETASHKMEQLGITVYNFYIILCEFNYSRNNSTSRHHAKKENYRLEMKNFLSMVFKDYNQYTVSVRGDALCTIISFPSDRVEGSLDEIRSRSREILDTINIFNGISIVIGISNLHSSSFDIPLAFKEANKSLSHKFYNDKSIFEYSKLFQEQAIQEKIPVNKYIENIKTSIKNGSVNEAVFLMKELMGKEKSTKQSSEHVKSTSLLICSICSTLLNDYNATLKDVIDEYENIFAEILQCETIEKLSQVLEMIIVRTSDFLSSINVQGNYIVKNALDYIYKNYHRPIKLKDIADSIHINSSYLSRLIRKETGETITEIITKYRVEKAKELLASENIKAYKVAEMVGIEDTAYFSFIFKKYTGKSPSEFKYLSK